MPCTNHKRDGKEDWPGVHELFEMKVKLKLRVELEEFVVTFLIGVVWYCRVVECKDWPGSVC